MRVATRTFLVALVAAGGLAWAQEEAAVQTAEKKWAAAITAKDATALGKMLGDQLIYAHSTGIVDTKSDYITKITSGKQKYEGVEQESTPVVKMYGSTAVVHAKMHMWGVNQSGKFDDHLMLMHVWVKSGGGWQMVAHQTTKLK